MVALSGEAGSFLAATVVGVAYVFGMVAPLFAIAALWDRRDWAEHPLLRSRRLRVRAFGRSLVVESSALVAGVVLIVMGVLAGILAFTGTAMAGKGWQATLTARLQHYGKVVLSWVNGLPGWAGIILIAALLALLARTAVRQYLDDADGLDDQPEQREDRPAESPEHVAEAVSRGRPPHEQAGPGAQPIQGGGGGHRTSAASPTASAPAGDPDRAIVVVVAGVALFFLTRSGGGSSSGGSHPTFAVGQPGPGAAAPEFKLASTSGGTFDLADQRGKTVLLYFQEGVGCQPCWDQIRDIEKNMAAFRALGIDEFVSVTGNPLNQLRQKVTDESLSTPVLADPDLTLGQSYRANQYGMMGTSADGHTFIVVGPDGNIRWRADYGGPLNLHGCTSGRRPSYDSTCGRGWPGADDAGHPAHPGRLQPV